MDQRIKDLWANNKIIFFIALPLILLWVFRDLVFAMLAGSARKASNEAKKEDAVIQKEFNQNEAEAGKLKAEADQIDKQIKERTENDIPEDWNKKK